MKHRKTAAGLLACGITIACSPPCVDDGLLQENCGEQTADDTDTAGGTTTATTSDSAGDTTGGGDGHGTADGDGIADGDGSGDDGDNATLWCADADGDGFGDPEQCELSAVQPEGTVDNDGDCDDTSDFTFPGAAPHDHLTACLRDQDGDDWGDIDPPAGVNTGTDCLDDNAFVYPGAAEHEPTLCAEDEDDDGWGDDHPPLGADAGLDCADQNPYAYPGAAEHESPPGLCTLDEDDDGWGDTDPDLEGPVPGHDCHDDNAALNPTDLKLSTFLHSGAEIPKSVLLTTIDPSSATTTAVVTLDDLGESTPIALSTATVDAQGHIFTNELASVQLHEIAYDGTCVDGGSFTPIGTPYGLPGDIVCGLEFGPGGFLYGIDNDDNLLTFSTLTGQIVSTTPIETEGIPLNIHSCGMAYDCVEDRLLVANGINHSIYAIDPTTAVAVNLRDLGASFAAPWDPVGLEYDVVTHVAYISTGNALYEVEVDSLSPPAFLGTFEQPVSSLEFLPVCSE